MRRWMLALALVVAGGEARAASCTDGTDCVCDQSWATGDARQLWCEDWEAITYYDGSPGNVGGGSPLYGPVYDSTGGAHSGKRGHNWIWRNRYGNGATGMWADGEPGGTPGAAVRLGNACDTGAAGGSDGGACNGMKEWCSAAQGLLVDGGAADCWQGNALSPLIDILRETDEDDEVSGLTLPEFPDASRGLSGTQAFAFRLKENSGAILGKSNGGSGFAQPHTVSFAYLVALSSNFTTAGSSVLSNPYKWDQVGDDSHFPNMWTTSCTSEQRPFCPIIQVESGTCADAIASHTSPTGSASCGSAFIVMIPDSGDYVRSTHWPDMNKWMCVRGKITGAGTSSTQYEVWRDNGSGSVKVIDIQGVDGTKVEAVTGWVPNGYSNYLETNTLSEAVFRYEDNIYVRGGTELQCAGGACDPPTCEQIGFGETGGGGSPTITISSSVASDSTPAFNTALNVTVTFSASDTTGTITAAVDCENNGGYEDGSNTGTSPITVSGVCPYTSSGSQTIGVRVQDTGPTASDTDTVAVTVEAAPPGDWSGNPTNTSGVGFYPPNRGGGGGGWMQRKF